MFDLETALTNADLVELARQAGSRLERCGSEWRGNCPLHGGDNPTAFVIYASQGKQRWHCFTRSECGGGDAIDFVMRWHGLDLAEACRYLAGESQPDAAALALAAAQRAQRAEEELRRQIEVAQRALDDLRAAQIWLTYHDNLTAETRQLWRARGIPDEFQNWWRLGYCPGYSLHTPAGRWLTPTLTIPIYAPAWQVLNVRHRLLNPYRPGDKYRPERAGLKNTPFLADPDIGYQAEKILIVEGEIKAMVTFLTAEWHGLQVIGLPGKNQCDDLAETLADRAVWVCLDPDARTEATRFARALKARLIHLPVKIDDAILSGALNSTGLRRLLENAKGVRHV